MPDSTGYTIRPALPAKFAQLPAIERAAAAQFRATAFASMADAPLASVAIDPTHDRVWVAVPRTGNSSASPSPDRSTTVSICTSSMSIRRTPGAASVAA